MEQSAPLATAAKAFDLEDELRGIPEIKNAIKELAPTRKLLNKVDRLFVLKNLVQLDAPRGPHHVPSTYTLHYLDLKVQELQIEHLVVAQQRLDCNLLLRLLVGCNSRGCKRPTASERLS